MRRRNRLDTSHHNTAPGISHVHHPHYAPTDDDYCRITSSNHTAIDQRATPATSCVRACPTYSRGTHA
ncbi:hypothetical protein [Nocardia abscessus]|uniref:hypothetical protein n=1 Tax=Nocardia abscessus TaxID=120957 RepID=UPI001E30C37D|nr:hypothetical protein [Nocardia abscessus]